MVLDVPPIVGAILNTLLDRWEQPERQTVVRVRLTQRDYGAYFSSTDAAPRRAANAVLGQLAQDGVIALHWRKWEEHNWLEAVDLVPHHANAIYTLLRRTPRGEQTTSLAELLQWETVHAPWHADFLQWAQDQLHRHRSVAPLKLDDARWNRDLLRALAAIAGTTQPMLERSFSARLFGNSKRLEALCPAIVTVLRRHDPDAASYGDDQWALLRAHHLDRAPEYVPLAGPIVLQTAEQVRLDLAPFVPSVALPATMLRTTTVVACAATTLVTVENVTSFTELAALRPPNVLLLYTGGFASPTVIGLLARIRTALPALRFHHWGDLDAGGLRILTHLRTHLGAVLPLAMDVQTAYEHYRHAQVLTNGDRQALRHLRASPLLGDCVEVIDALLTTGVKVEQEAVGAERVLRQLEDVDCNEGDGLVDHRQ